jgi:hypothetical protein
MANSNTEKITFNMPLELKNQAMQQKELKKWKRAAKSAAKDKKYTADMKEFGNDDGGLSKK